MKPLISVLMSVYNNEKYLDESVKSILEQSYKNFEFIIIDDASTDNSKNMILSYNDRRIKFYENKKNIGLTKSLNKGLNIAQGKYVVRQDADDISLPDRLTKQLDYITKKKCDILGCSSYQINNESEILNQIIQPVESEEIFFKLFFTNCITHSSVMFDKNKILELSGYNNKFFYSQDYELWTRVVSSGLKIHNLPEILIKFRNHNTNISFLKKKEQYNFRSIALSNYCKKNLNENISIEDIENITETYQEPQFAILKNRILLLKYIALIYLKFQDNIVFDKIKNSLLKKIFDVENSGQEKKLYESVNSILPDELRKEFFLCLNNEIAIYRIRKFIDKLNENKVNECYLYGYSSTGKYVKRLLNKLNIKIAGIYDKNIESVSKNKYVDIHSLKKKELNSHIIICSAGYSNILKTNAENAGFRKILIF